MEQGIVVSKPLFDVSKYDLILDINGCVIRVQIKSTNCLKKGVTKHYYSCMVSTGHAVKKRYNKNQIDFVAAYVIPEDAWYVIPIEDISAKGIKLYPHRENCNHKYEKYRIK